MSLIDQLFTKLADYIALNRALLQEGGELDLDQLGQIAQKLGEVAMTLSQEDRIDYSDKLDEVVQALIAFEEELRGKKVEIARELQGLGQMKKAAIAYRTTEASDNFRADDHEE